MTFLLLLKKMWKKLNGDISQAFFKSQNCFFFYLFYYFQNGLYSCSLLSWKYSCRGNHDHKMGLTPMFVKFPWIWYHGQVHKIGFLIMCTYSNTQNVTWQFEKSFHYVSFALFRNTLGEWIKNSMKKYIHSHGKYFK